jgi:hypothetical protein
MASSPLGTQWAHKSRNALKPSETLRGQKRLSDKAFYATVKPNATIRYAFKFIWGTGGPEFKSRRSDQLNQEVSTDLTPAASQKTVIGKQVGGIDGLGNIHGSQGNKPLQRSSSLSPEQMRAPLPFLEA